nr:RidA family protein [uncultured Cohaesibacter sp.]
MVNRYLPTPVLHRVVEKDGLVFVGGTACDDTSKDIKGQTLETLEKMEGYLKVAGSDKTKVLFATIYLASLDLKAGMSEVWGEWFDQEHLPARATLCSPDLGGDTLIEIFVTAYK